MAFSFSDRAVLSVQQPSGTADIPSVRDTSRQLHSSLKILSTDLWRSITHTARACLSVISSCRRLPILILIITERCLLFRSSRRTDWHVSQRSDQSVSHAHEPIPSLPHVSVEKDRTGSQLMQNGTSYELSPQLWTPNSSSDEVISCLVSEILLISKELHLWKTAASPVLDVSFRKYNEARRKRKRLLRML